MISGLTDIPSADTAERKTIQIVEPPKIWLEWLRLLSYPGENRPVREVYLARVRKELREIVYYLNVLAVLLTIIWTAIQIADYIRFGRK